MSQPVVVAGPEAFRAVAPVHLEEARQQLIGVCGQFDLSLHGEGDYLEGAIECLDLGLFEAAVVATEARSVWRDAAMIRRDPARNLFLIYQQEGQSLICQGETRTLLRPGGFHLVDSAYPSEFRYSGGLTRKISIHLPREETLKRLGGSGVGGLPIDPADPLSTALEAVLARIIRADRASALHLSDMLVELLATYLRCRELEVPSLDRASHDRLEQARALIRGNAATAGYGLEALSADMGLSRRSVQRLFSAVGETVTGALTEARLTRARRSLMAADSPSVAQIAYDAGYNDLSHFHRSFRERFGEAPGALRPKQRRN